MSAVPTGKRLGGHKHKNAQVQPNSNHVTQQHEPRTPVQPESARPESSSGVKRKREPLQESPPPPSSSESSVLTTSSSASPSPGPSEPPPPPPLKKRLATFLPLLAASNAELSLGAPRECAFEITDVDEQEAEQRAAAITLNKDGHHGSTERSSLVMDLDDPPPEHGGVEGEAADLEPYIEMNLNLGVLEDVAANKGADGEEDSDSEDDDEDMGLHPDGEVATSAKSGGDVLDELLHVGKGVRKRQKRQPGIVELT